MDQIFLITVAVLLFLIGRRDWLYREIGNGQCLLLLTCLLAHQLFASEPLFASISWGLLALVVGFTLFALNVWGAGDGKLVAVLVFGLAPSDAWIDALYGLAIATIITTVVVLLVGEKHRNIPYAIPLTTGYAYAVLLPLAL